MRLWYAFGMLWSPLILLCYVDSLDCAVPLAPVYFSEQSCLQAVDFVLDQLDLPEGMTVVGTTCYNWGAGA